jgi:hypothetical protein
MREFQRAEVSTVALPFPSDVERCLPAPCRFLPLQPIHERPIPDFIAVTGKLPMHQY